MGPYHSINSHYHVTESRRILRDAYLSQRWFANEKVCVFAAFRWVELGIQKSTPVCDGLQGSWALVREPKSDKQLQDRKAHHM